MLFSVCHFFCVVILYVNRSRSSFILYRIVKRHSRQSNVRRIWTCAENVQKRRFERLFAGVKSSSATCLRSMNAIHLKPVTLDRRLCCSAFVHVPNIT